MVPSGSCPFSEESIEEYAMGRAGAEEAAALEDHVFHCRHCQTRLEETRLFVAAMRLALGEYGAPECGGLPRPERRREPRVACAEDARIVVLEPDEQECDALLRDMSQSGAGLLTFQPIQPNSSLEIICSDFNLSGTVRYCAESHGFYEVGVELKTVRAGRPERSHHLGLVHKRSAAHTP